MNKKIIIILVVAILLGLIGGGIYMSRKGSEPTPTPTPDISMIEEMPTPEVTEATVDIKTLKIKVLNGTPVAGLAGKMKTTLELAGFTVDSTGNAITTDFTQVEIQAKSTVPTSALTQLKTEIEKIYTIGADNTLDSADENDIVVILGTKNQPTAVPTVAKSTTPTPTKAATVTTAVTPTLTLTPTPTKTQ